MRRAEIDEQNRYLLRQQRQFRMAADVVTDAFMVFPEVCAVAVIGSVAKPLWKEVPRFRAFRRARVEVWHECKDLDRAVWLASQERLGAFRLALERSRRNDQRDLREIAAIAAGVAGEQRPALDGGVGADEEVGQHTGARTTARAVSLEGLAGEKQRGARRRRDFDHRFGKHRVEVLDP